MTTHPHRPRSPLRDAMGRSPTAALFIVGGALMVIAGTVYVLLVVMNRTATPHMAQNAPPQPAPAPAATQPVPATPSEDALIPPKKVAAKADLTKTADEMTAAYGKLEEKYRAEHPAESNQTERLVMVDPGYRGKVIDVSGRVFGIRDGDFGHSVDLGGDGEKTRGVRCYLAMENIEQLKSIRRDQMITIRGTCKDLLTNIEMVDCAVLKIDSEP